MATKDRTKPFEVGDHVRILNSGFGVCRIVEIRGRLGPKGAMVYGVQVGKRRDDAYIEVLEQQLELAESDK